MTLRIAYVINSLEGGGAASPVPDILHVLQDAGASVKLFALLRKNGLALPPILDAGFDVAIRDGTTRDHAAAYRWLDREVTAWGATHLWTSLSRATLLGQWVGARRRLPVISWQHNAYLKPWNERLLRWQRNHSALWVADSHSVAALTAERLRIPPDKLVTWPIFAADPNAPQATPWQPGQPLHLGSLGRLHPAKGYDLLLAALARLDANGFRPPVPVQLRIAGTGDDADALSSAAREQTIAAVDLVGYTPQPTAFLAEQHVYLQPSRREGFCIAAHEAMAAGLPVIGAATGEMPLTIVPGHTGWIVPPGDVDALADALRGLLSAPDQLAPMGKAARARVLERFSQARFAAIGQSIVGRLPPPA